MSKTFVYTELQLSVPFADAPWREINPVLLQQPGFRNKTWLAGAGNHSLGGIYEFDGLENAKRFVIDYFPAEARRHGAPQTTRIFDGGVVEEASRDMGSVHFGRRLDRKPGAFVYTEVQTNVPFAQAPWRDMNPILKQQPGILAKTWLAGLHTNSIGGLYAFDTIDNARRFATDYFPTEAAKFEVAYTTRLFDATVVEAASRPLHSPFFV